MYAKYRNTYCVSYHYKANNRYVVKGEEMCILLLSSYLSQRTHKNYKGVVHRYNNYLVEGVVVRKCLLILDLKWTVLSKRQRI